VTRSSSGGARPRCFLRSDSLLSDDGARARRSMKLLSCRGVRRVDVAGARREAEAQRSTGLFNLLFV